MHISAIEVLERGINSGKKRNNFPKNVSSFLHCLAGLLLLSVALSHFAFLRITGFTGTFPNQVFPFFTNNNLYLTSGILEGTVALICFKYRGRDFTNYFILSFVATMLLYHWAFSFTGGMPCGCLGLLGRLLHVNKSSEEIIAYITLFVLTLTTTPWLCLKLRIVSKRVFGKVPLGLAIILTLQSAYCGNDPNQTIEIYGTYSATAVNAYTGERVVHDPDTVDAAFRVTICGNTWKITATNLTDVSCTNVDWFLSKNTVGQIWCDGTNTYTLQPIFPFGNITNFASISSSRFYFSWQTKNFLGMSLPWLTYCLSPSDLNSDRKWIINGVVALPVPWLSPRESPLAYAYKWAISPTDDGMFVDKVSLTRDSGLDLSEDKALLRPELIYPWSLAAYQLDRTRLDTLKQIPDGFVEAEFKCMEWYRTNSISIPSKSELKYFQFDPRHQLPYPMYQAELKMTSVNVLKEGEDNLFPQMSQPTTAVDFRYHKFNGNRIYNFAKYTIRPGESLKPADDPALLADAEYHLKHGPRYDAFLTNKHILVWALFGIVTLIPIAAMLIGKYKKQGR